MSLDNPSTAVAMSRTAAILCPRCACRLSIEGLHPGMRVQCSSCRQQFRLAPSVLVAAVANSAEIAESGSRRLSRPKHVSRWANLARVLGFLSLLPLVGIAAFVSGLLGLLDIRQHPAKQGMGRAVFGLVAGALTSLVWAFVGILLATMSMYSGSMGGGLSEPGADQVSPVASAGVPQHTAGRLENGLRVLVRPVQGAQHTALVVLYSIGGDHDPEGASGLAHLIEHLYITAAAGSTPARSADSFMQAYPAGWNAQTLDRCTIVATVFPRDRLDAELAEAAARMSRLQIRESDLDRERPRVIAEVQNMFGGVPQLAAYNNARERLRPTPLGGRKGGLPEHAGNMSLALVADRYHKYYKPRNAVLTVAGDVDLVDVRAKIEHHFAALPSGESVPDRFEPGEAQFDSVTEIAVQLPFAAAAELAVAYRVPPHDSELFPALLLHVARMGVQAARLHSAPQRFPIEFSPILDPSTLMVSLPLQQGETAAEAVARVDRVIAEIAAPALGAGDRIIAKNRFAIELGTATLADPLLAQNMYFVAFATARRAQLGLDSIDFAVAIDGVTADQFRRAAELYLAPSNRAAAVAKPE